jgi:hypothetical protein
MKTSKRRLILLIGLVILGVLFIWLLVNFVLFLRGILGQRLDTSETLSMLQLITEWLALVVTLAGFGAIYRELRAFLDRPKLSVTFNKIDTPPNYVVEIGLHNSGRVEANHFRLLLVCCSPKLPHTRVRPVEIMPNAGVPGLTLTHSMDEATLDHLLPPKCPSDTKVVYSWQGRTSRIHIYPDDQFLVATLSVSCPLHLQWRLDSGGGTQKGTRRFASPEPS